jgi:large subunit ribosomal protein L15
MRLHDLKPAPGSRKPKRRIGRGIAGKGGKTGGRGTKGQGARRGGGKGPYFEGGQLPLVRRLPFKRGFNNPFRIEYQEVNLWLLERTFDDGATIDPLSLMDAGLIRDSKAPVAVLGSGDVSKKLTIKANRFTKSAQAKIEAQGGSVEVLPLRISGPHATIKLLPKEQEQARYPAMKHED